jgi:hypothetical protein
MKGSNDQLSIATGNESHRSNNDPIFSPINPIPHLPPSKSGYLDIHSGGNPKAPTHLYCILSGSTLRCYANNPADVGRPAEMMVPVYELRVSDYTLTSTQSRRPQAFALLNKTKTSKIEFVCKNIGAMNQWTSVLKVSASCNVYQSYAILLFIFYATHSLF